MAKNPAPLPQKTKPVRDAKYLSWVRTLSCMNCDRSSGVHAHHATMGRGQGQKASDREAFPLCGWCHKQFHDGAGEFRHWDNEKRTAWQRDMVERTQAFWELLHDKTVF